MRRGRFGSYGCRGELFYGKALRVFGVKAKAIKYYGGNIVGISAIFSNSEVSMDGKPIDSIFKKKDLPNYCTYKFEECPDCKQMRRIDAIVSSSGYTKI